MDLKRLSIRCEGQSPLLQNRMPPEQLLRLWSKEKKVTGAQGRENTPRDEAAKKVYADESGKTFFLPSPMLMSCFIGAGVFIKLDGKRQISAAGKSMLGGMLSIEQHQIVLETPGWEVDIQQGRNPNGGEAVCIIRPRFDLWAFDFTALLDLGLLPEPRYRELIDIAGARIGLGDFRPAKKGTFGRFRVTHWKLEEMETSTAAE